MVNGGWLVRGIPSRLLTRTWDVGFLRPILQGKAYETGLGLALARLLYMAGAISGSHSGSTTRTSDMS